MKLGLGLYRNSITNENLQFALQCGVTHIVVHLVDYFKGNNPSLSRGDDNSGWGISENEDNLWTVAQLLAIKKQINDHGLIWEAIENFEPSHWYDILLDGPKREQQIEKIKSLIKVVGEAGIPVIGYNFSLAGVWGWSKAPVGRGNAVSLIYDESLLDMQQPIPNGMVWNMLYNTNADKGFLPAVSHEELWSRFESFLKEVIPVAESAGVKLALHPDDPPADYLRNTARLVNQPYKYDRMLDIINSSSNCIEFCMGAIQEMSEGDIYESIQKFASLDKIGYVHFRNVIGKVPQYREVFIDEGDIDMLKAIRLLKKNGFSGVLIPDHVPEVNCSAPWHAGMAYALGYMKAAIQMTDNE